MAREAEWLAAWLDGHGLHFEAQRWLREQPRSEADCAALLRLLNQLESRFDVLLAPLWPGGAATWQGLRVERGLWPAPGRDGMALLCDVRATLARWAYPASHIARAEQLWRDFLLLAGGEFNALQAGAGWVAALDYLLQGLYFTGESSQDAVARRHGVSASTLGLRYRALIERLGIVLFDHPARKRLLAQRALAVESGAMSEAEFNRRLLRGEPLWDGAP